MTKKENNEKKIRYCRYEIYIYRVNLNKDEASSDYQSLSLFKTSRGIAF